MAIWLLIPVGFIGLLAVGTWLLRVRIRRIAGSRPGERFESFRTAFAGSNIPDGIVAAVYKKLQDWCSDSIPAFPVRANDDIASVYGMVDDDLDAAVLELLTECRRAVPDAETEFQPGPIVTVGDLVRFIAACERLV